MNAVIKINMSVCQQMIKHIHRMLIVNVGLLLVILIRVMVILNSGEWFVL